ncbi:ATP-dependent DNA helicase RecQ [Corynebacterium afermentans subsp. lipophilum]|uniref:RecQ family ATP-dependent DNA helicase n=1 Tax=Corynebacterium afermentans TaxID=38286 RepID=UPI00188ACEAF|nr:ATP-dependent DNA helicase RecQ [Corynebacterium afermentans]MBF4548571.1 ATP-dependent DNA helicase RecQ [Corynebacterium afermentans subsp. lipophilum]
MTATREQADELLKGIAGPQAALRDDQWTAIDSLVNQRKRMLVVQRTGWGKSAVYFIAAKLLREAGEGPSIIVSPLLALMRNQVEAAARAGIRAATINSANMTQWEEIQAGVDDLDLLLISPERLNAPGFREEVLPHLAQSVGMLVVDEAHCISDWGHDFRPDYRRISLLISDLPANTPVLATTATANDRVVADVVAQLGEGTGVLRGGLDRESLSLNVVRLGDPTQRAAWIAQYLAQVEGSGIIYCLTVAAAHDLAEALATAGWNVAAYTGRTEAEERERLEQALINNELKALVATSALGMGFDKPDLGFVVHLGAPSSPVSYYQQIGRAGRATDHAEVVLLPGPEDQRVWEYFVSVSMPEEPVVKQLLGALGDEPVSTPKLENAVDLSRSRIDQALKVLDVDGAVQRVKGGWVATGAPWAYDHERYDGLADARGREQDLMLAYETTDACRMVFLRSELDDPTIGQGERCGRCDNCTGNYLPTDVDPALAERIDARLKAPGVPLSQRKMWPTGSARRGKIKGVQAGKALGRLNDVARGPALAQLLRDNTYRPATNWRDDQWLTRFVAVLADWDWDIRPATVVALGSADPARAEMVASTAEALARVGQMSYGGAVRAGETEVQARNSAFRVNALDRYFDYSGLDVGEGPVLLLVGEVDSAWSVTVAAADIAERFGVEVLPLAFASRA